MFLTNASSSVDKLSKSNPVAANKSANASFEGANTVKGPLPCNVVTKSVACNAVC